MLLYTGEWINYGLSWPMFLKPLAPCHLISATAEMFNTASVHAIGILDARSLVPLLVRRFAPSVGICWPSKLELATPVDKPHGPSLFLRIRKNKTPVFGQTWLFPSSDKQKNRAAWFLFMLFPQSWGIAIFPYHHSYGRH
jgi:hypothetical protein